jgi:hypothetical protein
VRAQTQLRSDCVLWHQHTLLIAIASVGADARYTLDAGSDHTEVIAVSQMSSDAETFKLDVSLDVTHNGSNRAHKGWSHTYPRVLL